MKRRNFLGLSISVFAGCTSQYSSGNSSPPSTNVRDNTPTVDTFSSIPTPTEDCSVASLPNSTYPSLPEDTSRSAVKKFAKAFEKSFARAKLEESGADVNGIDSWEVKVREEAGQQFLVRVELELSYTQESNAQFTEESSNPTLAGTETFHGWYYVTDRFAVRASGSGSAEVPTSNWETVACRDLNTDA